MKSAWRGSKSRKSVKIAFALVMLCALTLVALPVYRLHMRRVDERACKRQRADILAHFDSYRARLDPGANLMYYAEAAYGNLGAFCPEGGQYVERERDGESVLLCTYHDEVPATIALVPPDTDAALKADARLLYESFDALLTELLAQSPALDPGGRSYISMNGRDTLAAADGALIPVAQEWRNRLNYDDTFFAQPPKAFFKLDAAGRAIPALSHVFVKTDAGWVKCGANGAESGTGIARESTPPGK